jgi:hypothetical protein
MSETKPVQPKRWNENAVPPCAVSYHFTLLDITNELRYCCHGEKTHAKHTNLTEQWSNDVYNQFRQDWSENYKAKKGLCLGCPHHEENKVFGEMINDYLALHADSED